MKLPAIKTSPASLSSLLLLLVSPALKVVLSATCVLLPLLMAATFAALAESREAVNQPPDIADELIKEFAEYDDAYNVAAEPCVLNVQSDLPSPDEPQPLYLRPGSADLWLPNAQGQLVVPRAAAIELHCPGRGGLANVSASEPLPLGTPQLRVTCVEGKTFSWGERGAKAEFGRFHCRQWPWYSVERVGACGPAAAPAQLYRVGFNLTQARFVESFQLCHDDGVLRALYARHTLTPAHRHFQHNVRRLDFSTAGGHFRGQNMNELYTQRRQHAVAQQLYGELHARYLNGSSLFLARGHLAAKADMIYANGQRSTFNFYNVAPQWQSFNGGQWAALEDQVRRFAGQLAAPLDCWTGVWGTLALRTAGGAARDFHLAPAVNGTALLPVPRLFYRVLVERAPGRQRGVALLGVNNPHATLAEIRADYVICGDVREQVPWLRWLRNDNLRRGYVYACRVADLARVVTELPRQLLEVGELLAAA